MSRLPSKEWIEDLDRRENAHLTKTPEPLVEYLQSIFPDPPTKENFRVAVLENEYCAGAWSVWVRDQKVNTFFGENAHERAMECARDLIDKNQS
jgi:hypothetical protein